MTDDAAPNTRVVTVAATGIYAVRLRDFGVTVVASVEEAPADDVVVVVGDPAAYAADTRVAYVVRPKLPDAELRSLLRAIATGHAIARPPTQLPAETPDEARRAPRAFQASRRLASANDLRTTETIIVEGIQELCGADRAYCLFFSASDGSLWSEIAALEHRSV